MRNKSDQFTAVFAFVEIVSKGDGQTVEEIRDIFNKLVPPEYAYRTGQTAYKVATKATMDGIIKCGKNKLFKTALDHLRNIGSITIENNKVFRTDKMVASAPELFLYLIKDKSLNEFATRMAEVMIPKKVILSHHARVVLREIMIMEGVLPEGTSEKIRDAHARSGVKNAARKGIPSENSV